MCMDEKFIYLLFEQWILLTQLADTRFSNPQKRSQFSICSYPQNLF